MISIYDLKPKFQNLLRPLVDAIAKIGVTPNQVTWAALLLCAAAGAAVGLTEGASWALAIVPLVLFVRMALNAIDGMLAKEYAMTSDAGAVLNEMGDVASDAAFYLPLAVVPGVPAAWIVLFVVVGIFTEMAGVLGAVIGKQRHYDGPMGKSDRAFVVGLVALLLGIGVAPGPWVDTVVIAATALGVVTVVRRCRKGLS
jgi:CDP-diacylglycerol--glycerol-3-phosphate 3-phosphatidyltransferase